MELQKCNLFQHTVDYIGNIFTWKSLRRKKNQFGSSLQIRQKKDRNPLIFRTLLRVLSVFPNFARVAAPLNQFLCKDEPTDLSEPTVAYQRAFYALKDTIKIPQILQLPQPNLPYYVDTDERRDQIECAIMQTYSDGTRSIGFQSRSLRSAERNYSTGKRECLGVILDSQILILPLAQAIRTLHLPSSQKMAYGSGGSQRTTFVLDTWSYFVKIQGFLRKVTKNTISYAISRPRDTCTYPGLRNNLL